MVEGCGSRPACSRCTGFMSPLRRSIPFDGIRILSHYRSGRGNKMETPSVMSRVQCIFSRSILGSASSLYFLMGR
jgi:hypothetical protein